MPTSIKHLGFHARISNTVGLLKSPIADPAGHMEQEQPKKTNQKKGCKHKVLYK